VSNACLLHLVENDFNSEYLHLCNVSVSTFAKFAISQNWWEYRGHIQFGSVGTTMSYRFDFDSTLRILRCRFEGRVTDDELKVYYLAAGRLVAVKDPTSAITDFTAADSVDVSPGPSAS
jgi:hypothetical protein